MDKPTRIQPRRSIAQRPELAEALEQLARRIRQDAMQQSVPTRTSLSIGIEGGEVLLTDGYATFWLTPASALQLAMNLTEAVRQIEGPQR